MKESAISRYVHTNLIPDDADRLIAFYKNVFRCRSIGEVRDLRGKWLDEMTGLEHAHITGEHLALPGYGDNLPTLEIFSYESAQDAVVSDVNRPGFAHIAFEVDGVRQYVQAMPALCDISPSPACYIVSELDSVNPGVYRDSMVPLVANDVAEALAKICERGSNESRSPHCE